MTNHKNENNETIHRIATKKALKKLDVANAVTYNQQILEKAIQKAIDGGWLSDYEELHRLPGDRVGAYKFSALVHFGEKQQAVTFERSLNDLIFNHDFAKALWGEATSPESETGYFTEELGLYSASADDTNNLRLEFKGEPWQYYLQQMVIADDPIKYLGDHL